MTRDEHNRGMLCCPLPCNRKGWRPTTNLQYTHHVDVTSKLFSILLVSGLISCAACFPTTAEKMQREKGGGASLAGRGWLQREVSYTQLAGTDVEHRAACVYFRQKIKKLPVVASCILSVCFTRHMNFHRDSNGGGGGCPSYNFLRFFRPPPPPCPCPG